MAQIQGVLITEKKRIFDDRGGIYHMLRSNDKEFQKFGEIYFSKIYPGVVKAWHYHKEMTLNYMLLTGSIRLVLMDARKDSATQGQVQEIFLTEQTSQLVTIPPGIWNGFKGLGDTASLVANCSTHPHSPEEILRRPHDDPEFKYDWSQRHG